MILEPRRFLSNKALFLSSKSHISFGWFTILCLMFMIIFLFKNPLLAESSTQFTLILISALLMWIFRLVPEYIPTILIIISALFLHIAPQRTILSGFCSDSFFLALSVFAVGAIVSKSRLFYRFSLMLLIRLPFRESLLQKCLFFVGALMTPVMSVQSSRMALIAPLLDDIMESSKITPRSTTANGLANAAFNGCILLSTIFLTGKSSNFIIYGLLAQQNQWQGNWFNWLVLASFPGLLLILIFFFLQFLLFKPQHNLKINRFKLKRELYFMGKISPEEYSALLTFCIFFIGTLFSSWNNNYSIWTCLAIFLIALTTGVLDKKEIGTRINWGFLFYFGAIIGVMRALQSIGIDQWLITHLQWLTYLAKNHTACFMTLIYGISWLGGLLLGTMIAPAILFTAIIPFAVQSPVSNWVIAFIILMATEAWIFPYQSSYYLCFEELLRRNNNFLLKPLLSLNAWFTLLKLGVVLASIPFWYFLGVLN